MLQREPLNVGDLIGTVYTFPEIGDRLEPHLHPTEETNHLTVAARGRFRCIGSERINGKEIAAGETMTFDVNEMHGFEALEQNSIMINIRKWRAP